VASIGLGLLGGLLVGEVVARADPRLALALAVLLGGWLIVNRSWVTADGAVNDEGRSDGPGAHVGAPPGAHAGGGDQPGALVGLPPPPRPRSRGTGAGLPARAGPPPAPPRRRLPSPRAVRWRYRLARRAAAAAGGLLAAVAVGTALDGVAARGLTAGPAFYALAPLLLAVGAGLPWLIVGGLWRRKRRREGWGL
jgi:hypothetical protein